MSGRVYPRPIEEDASFMGRHKRFMMALPASWSAQTRLVAITLFAHAHDNGSGIYVGIQRILAMTGLSKASVMRSLRLLDKAGVMQRDGVHTHPNGVQTTLRRLNLSRIVELANLEKSDGVAGDTGVTDKRHGVAGDTLPSVAGDTQTDSINQEITERNLSSSPVANDGEVVRDHFEDFWEAYPKKVGKGHARKAWAKAMKRTTPAVIATKLASLNNHWPRSASDPRKKHIPHAATWLNREGWLDDESDIAAQMRQEYLSHDAEARASVQQGLDWDYLEGRNRQ